MPRLRPFWLLGLINLLSAQALQVQFTGYEPPLLIPVDTTWREYKIPMELFLQLDSLYAGEVVYTLMENDTTGPDSSHFWIDRIHFPSNAWETFEDSAQVSLDSPNGTGIRYRYSPDTPDGDGTSLQLSYTRTDSKPVEFRLTVLDPGDSYTMIPDTVGFWMKAAEMADLTWYVPLDWGNLWVLSSNTHSAGEFVGIIEGITSVIYLDSAICYSSDTWHYSSDTDAHEVRFTPHTYTLNPSHPDRVFVDGVPRDFDLRPGESSSGLTLIGESYASVLDIPTFVKYHDTDLAGAEDFAYDLGRIYYHDGEGPVLSLTGAVIKGQQRGQINLQNRVGVGISDMWIGLSTYPPDSIWHRYVLPLSRIMSPYADQDSFITIRFKPEVFLSGLAGGQICLDDIAVVRGDERLFVIDDFDDGIVDWQVEFALNGSHLDLELSGNVYPMGGFSLMMNFYNGWQWGEFEGWMYKTVYLDSSIVLSPTDELVFWMKDRQADLAIAPRRAPLPVAWELRQNYPNPFNAVSTIEYDLPQASNASLIVYDILGREVARLVECYTEAGSHSVQWNGRDQLGRDVPSGIYIARLVTPEYTRSIKMALLR